MTKIEFSETLQFGEKLITAISVSPLTFVSLVETNTKVSAEARGKTTLDFQVVLQRRRIQFQTAFMAGVERVVPTDANIAAMPLPVARSIINALDIGEGVAGKIVHSGDAVGSPVLYKLGTPITMLINKQEQKITELEFKAASYGEMERVLAAGSAGDELGQALEFIRTIASPVELESAKILPSWAVDRITVADGVTIMREVLPSFLG